MTLRLFKRVIFSHLFVLHLNSSSLYFTTTPSDHSLPQNLLIKFSTASLFYHNSFPPTSYLNNFSLYFPLPPTPNTLPQPFLYFISSSHTCTLPQTLLIELYFNSSSQKFTSTTLPLLYLNPSSWYYTSVAPPNTIPKTPLPVLYLNCSSLYFTSTPYPYTLPK